MATIEGSFSGKPYNYAHPYIDYSYTQDIAGNYSDITATLHFYFTSNYNGYNLANNHGNTANINGVTSFANTNFDGRGTQPKDVTIRTFTQRVYHNGDGTKQVWIGWDGNTRISAGTYNFGATITLNTIPREAYITNDVSFVIGNNIGLTIYNAGNLYVKTWLYVNNSLIKSTSHGQTSSTSITLGGGYDTAIYAQVPNATAVSMYVILRTYSDSGYTSQVGNERIQYGTAYVNTSINVPTFTTYTVASVDKTINVVDKYSNALVTSYTNTLTGSAQKIISGYSKIRGTITSGNKMVALNSATAIKYRFVNGVQANDGNYSAGSTVDIDIDNATAIATTMTAYDSRALTTSATPVSLTSMVEYTPPVLSSLVMDRDNQIDAPVNFTIAGSYWKEYFGGGTAGVQNTITAHYRYKETTESWASQTWNSLTLTDSSGTLSYDNYLNGDLGASGFTVNKSFDIEVRIYDKLNSYIIERTLNRGVPLMDLTQDGIAINALYDSGRGGNLQVSQPSWTAPSFSNSWVNYGSGFATCGYMKDSMGFVHLRGLVKDGTGMNTTIFTLPTGFRPTEQWIFGVASNNAYGEVRIASDGTVKAPQGATAWVSLDGIVFNTA